MSANPYNGACTTEVNAAAAKSVQKSSAFSTELRRRVLHFTPAWFSVNMGTGITSILLHNLPYNNVYLQRISICIFVLNIALFVVFVGISAARYTMFPQVWKLMIRNPAQSLFLGTFPMGFATIINMVVFVCVPAFGDRFVYLAWSLWWIDILLSVAVGLGVCFMMFTRQKHSLDKLTAVWLLPIVPAVVAAASGGIVANVLAPIAPDHARTTILVSYFIWGMGVPISFLVMALYFHRLCVHHVPPSEQIVSVFLPIGPCGQGAFGIMQLGKVLRNLAYTDSLSFGSALPSGANDVKIIASAIYGASLVVGLVLWGVGVFWLCIAVSTIVDIKRKGGFPINMGAWGFTFPLGVLTTATTLLATELDSIAFKVVGTVFSICVILLWMYVSAWTAYKAFDGSMFVAPCLAQMDKIQQSGNANATGSPI